MSADSPASPAETLNVTLKFADVATFVARFANLVEHRRIVDFSAAAAERILGSSMDIFHKSPAHQRRMLADPKQYPIRGTIQIGEEFFELIVSAAYDEQKNFLGSLVSWNCVTEKLANEQAIKEGLERERQQADNLRIKATGLAASSEELTAVSVQMSINAKETSSQAMIVSAARSPVPTR